MRDEDLSRVYLAWRWFEDVVLALCITDMYHNACGVCLESDVEYYAARCNTKRLAALTRDSTSHGEMRYEELGRKDKFGAVRTFCTLIDLCNNYPCYPVDLIRDHAREQNTDPITFYNPTRAYSCHSFHQYPSAPASASQRPVLDDLGSSLGHPSPRSSSPMPGPSPRRSTSRRGR